MPAKNSLKEYVPGGYYHLYNRGVEKRKIFQDEMDYSVFLSYLREYLSPKEDESLRSRLNEPDISSKEKAKIIQKLRMNNFYNEINLLAFCLMPNHFHLLIKQKDFDSMDRFMNSICTRYTMYFNKKYRRVGSLFQGVYKAVLVDKEEYLLHLSRYIHFQAGNLPSSLDAYLGKSRVTWIDNSLILSYFSRTNRSLSYESFVFQSDTDSFGEISRLLIE